MHINSFLFYVHSFAFSKLVFSQLHSKLKSLCWANTIYQSLWSSFDWANTGQIEKFVSLEIACVNSVKSYPFTPPTNIHMTMIFQFLVIFVWIRKIISIFISVITEAYMLLLCRLLVVLRSTLSTQWIALLLHLLMAILLCNGHATNIYAYELNKAH